MADIPTVAEVRDFIAGLRVPTTTHADGRVELRQEDALSLLRGGDILARLDPDTQVIVTVQSLAKALHADRGHRDLHPDFRGCSSCSPDAAAIVARMLSIGSEGAGEGG